MKFEPIELRRVVVSDTKETASFELLNSDDEPLFLTFTRSFGAHIVSQCQSIFRAMETRAFIKEGTTPEIRKSWDQESGRIPGDIVAAIGDEKSQLPVLLSVDRASPYETTYLLSRQQAEALGQSLLAASRRLPDPKA
jgi:hypothetical protein